MVVLSVVVDPAYQRQGNAEALMVEFVKRMTELGKTSIHLMCREQHIPLYEKFGYLYIQPLASDHGGMVWHEMIMTL